MLRSPSNGHTHADLDINDKCNLKCPTCWRGVAAQKNTSATMPLSTFRRVVRKLKAEGYPNVALINWTEPFLCRTLDEYVTIVKEAGLDCWLSSNLSLPPKNYLPTMISGLAAGVDFLFISVSGFTQEIYEINHVGGRLDWIFENAEAIARERQAGRIKTNVWVRYLEFPYNSYEKAPWADYAARLDLGFVPVPAYGNPRDPLPPAHVFSEYVRDRVATAPPPGLAEGETPAKICSLIADRVAIDAKGDAYLCCAYPNAAELRIGPYVDMSSGELLLRRTKHPFCATCKIATVRDTTSEDRARFARAYATSATHDNTRLIKPDRHDHLRTPGQDACRDVISQYEISINT